jgi:hypothetical protein
MRPTCPPRLLFPPKTRHTSQLSFLTLTLRAQPFLRLSFDRLPSLHSGKGFPYSSRSAHGLLPWLLGRLMARGLGDSTVMSAGFSFFLFLYTVRHSRAPVSSPWWLCAPGGYGYGRIVLALVLVLCWVPLCCEERLCTCRVFFLFIY